MSDAMHTLTSVIWNDLRFSCLKAIRRPCNGQRDFEEWKVWRGSRGIVECHCREPGKRSFCGPAGRPQGPLWGRSAAGWKSLPAGGSSFMMVHSALASWVPFSSLSVLNKFLFLACTNQVFIYVGMMCSFNTEYMYNDQTRIIDLFILLYTLLTFLGLHYLW